jgi:UDP-2,4-diacetamido-2,4,6-trideoxy-beta-L-altropyranose hydrolase
VDIAFRVDASVSIGIGHVMRCLTLADELKRKGVNSIFLTHERCGAFKDLILHRGYKCEILSYEIKHIDQNSRNSNYQPWKGFPIEIDVDAVKKILNKNKLQWMVVDHYGIDASWHSSFRDVADNLLVIDDLADRKYECDLLLDQTYGRMKSDYNGLISMGCKLLLGSKYAMLRPEFLQLRSAAITKRKKLTRVKKIMISMGGADEKNVSTKILRSIKNIQWEEYPEINVVIGSSAPYLKQLYDEIKGFPMQVDISVDVNDMAIRMYEADIAIGAAGSTSWERCCLGLPSFMITVAENQKLIASHIHEAGAAINLGVDESLDEKTMSNRLSKLISDIESIHKMSDKAVKLVDGLGVKRVVQEMGF